MDKDARVSIHTPTKGVTLNLLIFLQGSSSFNPHTHEGCDYSRFPSRSRGISFNPHTHEGCDVLDLPKRPPTRVSIHTPTKGVTHKLLQGHKYHTVSIHTPTKGVTKGDKITITGKFVSIHTPTKGVTHVKHLSPSFHVFQSTHPRRV